MTAVKLPGCVKYAAKAVTAAVVTFAGSVSTAAASGHITTAEWIAAAGAAVVALGAVFGVSNTQ